MWLIGPTAEVITGRRLPTNKQVLSCFFYHHISEKKTIHESAICAVNKVVSFWQEAKIPTKPVQHTIKKLEKYVNSYKLLKKNKNRTTENQKQKEEEFLVNLDNLFDIAHDNAIKLITIDEDRAFLLDQRQGRKGYMASVDRNLCKTEEKVAQRNKKRLLREEKEKSRKEESLIVKVPNYSSCEEEDEEMDKGNDENFKVKSTPCSKNKKLKPQQTSPYSPIIVTPVVAAALDRTSISDRDATYVIAATVHSLGHKVDDYNISRSSIRKARISYRKEMTENVKADFSTLNPDISFVLHWDGKLLPGISGSGIEKIDRLAILVTGGGFEKLLGVPKIPNGTGEAVAAVTIKTLEEWKLTKQVKGLCFDTTSSNTGINSGACTLIEKRMGRNLLYFACRHHIHEIILADVFTLCFGPSSGPDVLLFKRFKDYWNFIDQEKFETYKTDEMGQIMVAAKLLELKKYAIEFAFTTLRNEKQPRDDYREFLELVLIFLGETPPKGIHFRAPGAFHHARWMAKIIYCLKIWLFHQQFKLTPREKNALIEFNLFVALLYMKHWFTATIATEAPVHDLQFLVKLHEYAEFNKNVASKATTAIKRHLWYLGEELVGLSLFSNNVPAETKVSMVQALKKQTTQKQLKRLDAKTKDIHLKSLEDFVTAKSLTLFNSMQLDTSFLEVDPSEWKGLDSYKKSRDIVKGIKVVNDCAERGVALITQFNDKLTKNEEQKQYLLQVVENHRKQFKTSEKTTLMKMGASIDSVAVQIASTSTS